MKIDKSSLIASIILVALCAGFLLYKENVRGKLFRAGDLTVWVFDIGQGDAIFIDGPEKQVLIDGGPDAKVLEKLSAVMMPWNRSIDTVVLTHPHADHVNGLLPVLERYAVTNVYDSGQGYDTAEFKEFENLAPRHRAIIAGEQIDLGGGATLTALWPESSYDNKEISDPNDGSVVFLLEYGDTTMLLAGDAGVDEEETWTSPHVDVLKAGHHGSRTSSSEDLLQTITPNAAIISVGAVNDYGLPDEDVQSRFAKSGIIVYRTDIHGDIRVRTLGGEPEISTLNL
jgi:competence protein ComEC